MIALGWANIGAAVAPDAALASVASAIILVLGGKVLKVFLQRLPSQFFSGCRFVLNNDRSDSCGSNRSQ